MDNMNIKINTDFSQMRNQLRDIQKITQTIAAQMSKNFSGIGNEIAKVSERTKSLRQALIDLRSVRGVSENLNGLNRTLIALNASITANQLGRLASDVLRVARDAGSLRSALLGVSGLMGGPRVAAVTAAAGALALFLTREDEVDKVSRKLDETLLKLRFTQDKMKNTTKEGAKVLKEHTDQLKKNALAHLNAAIERRKAVESQRDALELGGDFTIAPDARKALDAQLKEMKNKIILMKADIETNGIKIPVEVIIPNSESIKKSILKQLAPSSVPSSPLRVPFTNPQAMASVNPKSDILSGGIGNDFLSGGQGTDILRAVPNLPRRVNFAAQLRKNTPALNEQKTAIEGLVQSIDKGINVTNLFDQAFTQLTQTGKINFKSLARSVLGDVQRMLTGSGGKGGIGGLLSGLLGGATKSSGGGGFSLQHI